MALRSPTVASIIDRVWARPILEGLPPDTCFNHWTTDSAVIAMLTTYPSFGATAREIVTYDEAKHMTSNSPHLAHKMDLELSRLRDQHRLGYEYGIFPGWRF